MIFAIVCALCVYMNVQEGFSNVHPSDIFIIHGIISAACMGSVCVIVKKK